MIMELGVLLPVFLIPPEVVINLSLSCMGLMFIVGGILIAIPAVSMIAKLRLDHAPNIGLIVVRSFWWPVNNPFAVQVGTPCVMSLENVVSGSPSLIIFFDIVAKAWSRNFVKAYLAHWF